MRKLIPERLQMARRMRGMSMGDVADASKGGISKMSISKIERGLLKPSQRAIDLLASVLQVPVSYFEGDKKFSISNLNFRFEGDIPSKDAERLVLMATERLERYVELEKVLGIKQAFRNPLSSIVVKDYNAAEQAAERLRARWNIGVQPIYSVYEILENNGVKVVEFSAGITDVLGFSTMVNGKIPLIIINTDANATTERKRFTALHELGHLLLSLHPEEGAIVNERPVTCERLAHRFANAMLVPASVFTDKLGTRRSHLIKEELVEFKNQYGISVAALVHRAHDLGIISDSYYNHIFDDHLKKSGFDDPSWGAYPIEEKANRYNRLLARVIAEGVVEHPEDLLISDGEFEKIKTDNEIL